MHEFLQSNKDYIDIINIIAILIGLYGFVLTIRQLKSSSKDSKKIIELGSSLGVQLVFFEKQNQQLTDISNALTTKYIGKFPQFVPDTVKLIKGAKENIIIVCDFPSYCYFSDHKTYVEYTNDIHTKIAANINVELICPDLENRNKLVLKQFESNDKDWKDVLGIKDKLIEFIKRERLNIDFDSFTIQDFVNSIESINLRTIDYVFKGKCYEVDRQFPLYFWIIDDLSAIFTIPSFTEHDGEQGFYTNDPKLILALKSISNNLKKKI